MPRLPALRPYRWLQQHVSLSDVVLVLAAVLVAIGLRSIWVLHSDARPVPNIDSSWYQSVAQSVAAGDGISNPDGGQPTALYPPGYPLLLGAAYKFFGSELRTAQAVNIAAAGLSVLFTYAIGRMAASKGVATLGGWIFAVFPSQVLFSSLVMSESVFTLVLLSSIGAVLVASRLRERPAAAAMVVAGLLAGASVLFRGQAIVLLAVVPLWWAIRHEKRLRLAPMTLFVSVIVLVVVPWSVRNWVQLDAPVLLSTNAGWDATIGHNPEADGGWMYPGYFFLSAARLPNPAREVKIYEDGLDLAWSYATGHPDRELELSARKAVRLWKNDSEAVDWQELGRKRFLGRTERNTLTWLCNSFYFSLLGLSAIGLLCFRQRWRGLGLMIVLLAAGWTLFHVAIFSEPRFHYPLAPFLGLAGAAGLVGATRVARERWDRLLADAASREASARRESLS